MKCTTLGIEVAKTVFQLHGVDKEGAVVVQRRVSRGKLLETVLGGKKSRLTQLCCTIPRCLPTVTIRGDVTFWGHVLELLMREV